MQDSLYPLFVVGAVLGANVFQEVITWLLIYRTEGYKRLESFFVSRSKQQSSIKLKGSASKKDKRFEETTASKYRELMAVRFKTSALTMAIMFGLFRLVLKSAPSVPVATLPFVPPGFLKSFFRGQLKTEDLTACGTTAIYVLSAMIMRSNVAKLLGLGPAREMASVTPSWEDTLKEAKAKAM